jgi:hypothetical protein
LSAGKDKRENFNQLLPHPPENKKGAVDIPPRLFY